MKADPPFLSRKSTWRLWLAVILVAVVLVGFTAYEDWAFGWHPAREEPAGFTPWHWFRMGVCLIAATLLVVTCALTGRDTPEGRAPLSPAMLVLSWIIAGLAAAATVLFLADPHAFNLLTVEDGPVEWLSALFLFVACGFMLLALARLAMQADKPRPWLQLAGTAGLAGQFFVMAMEEISWFQRVIGFETPESMAERNWQSEFNLHNLQTDYTELGLYSATGIFLVLLPLMRETVGDWRPLAPFRKLLPDRPVAAASAPMLLFTYGHWNLLPVQSVFWIGLAACTLFALRASGRGWGGEARLFAALTILLAVGQAIFLLYGYRSEEIFDSTEYREWFIAFGLAVYGWRQWGAAGMSD